MKTVHTGCGECLSKLAPPADAEATELLGLCAHGAACGGELALSSLPEAAVRAVIGMHSGDRSWLQPGLAGLQHDLARQPAGLFRFLIERGEAPSHNARIDGEVRSYALGRAMVELLVRDADDLDVGSCFEVAQRLLDGSVPDLEVDAVQVPLDEAPCRGPADRGSVRSTWIIPHRGFLGYLDACLAQVERVDMGGAPRQVRVCFDEELSELHPKLVARHADVQFNRVVPPGAGPYVVQHLIAEDSADDVVVWQDSDDLPSRDRWSVLIDAMQAGGADLVGSHEVIVDELARAVLARRYPLDVTAALRQGPHTAQLFGATAVRREALLAAGGLSTRLPFDCDTQFLWRAYHFGLRLCNADAFVYVRRRHGGSMTSAEELVGSGIRRRLRRTWTNDFRRVQRGECSLEVSSLRPLRGAELAERRLEPLDKAILATARARRAWRGVTTCPSCIGIAVAEAPAARHLLLVLTAHDPVACRSVFEQWDGWGGAVPWGALVLHADDRQALTPHLRDVASDEVAGDHKFRFLVPWIAPPTDTVRDDGDVQSYTVSGDLLAVLAPGREAAWEPALGCFGAFERVLAGHPRAVLNLAVRQLPRSTPEHSEPPLRVPSSDWIVPHRGPLAWLERCLRQVTAGLEPNAGMRLQVCFDEPVGPRHRALMAGHPVPSYYRVEPPGAGPFFPSHVLALRSDRDVLVWQDSDDVPCSDRFTRLSEEMAVTGADCVGCHELRLDELERRVVALRYPLDVNRALADQPYHALLHPTSMIRTESFRMLGGLSTWPLLEADTQLMLRAIFSLRVRNADAFLYLRRWRGGSFTSGVSPDVRRWRLSCRWTWNRAFARAKRGVAVMDTDLRPLHGPEIQQRSVLAL